MPARVDCPELLREAVQEFANRFLCEPQLTVIETCRQQGRNVFSFLTAAIQSHLARQPAPSLLPGV